MTEPVYLSVEDDLDWQRDVSVGELGTPDAIADGNRQGVEVDLDDDEDHGL